jgi:hypothetical protein
MRRGRGFDGRFVGVEGQASAALGLQLLELFLHLGAPRLEADLAEGRSPDRLFRVSPDLRQG